MSEPRLEDDIALGKNQDCDDCEQSEDECTCSESAYDTLEEMYDDLQYQCRGTRLRYRPIIRGGHDGLYPVEVRISEYIARYEYSSRLLTVRVS